MLYSFMYELPKTNHRYGLSGIRLKVEAELHEGDFIYIDCERFLVADIKNHEEAHREMIMQAREIIAKSHKPLTREQREIDGERMLIEWFDNFGYTKPNSLFFMLFIILMALIIHPLH